MYDRATALRAIGLSIAACVGIVATSGSIPTAAGFLAAIALFLAAERAQTSAPDARPVPSGLAWSGLTKTLVGIGLLSSLVASAGVGLGLGQAAQHTPWAIALLAFAAAACTTTSAPAARFETVDWVAISVLGVISAALFFAKLTDTPPIVHGDEVETAIDALHLLEDPHRGIFSTGWFALPILHSAPAALGMLLFGADLFGVRMTSALIAMATVFLLFALVRRLLGTGPAFCAALLLSSQRFFIHLGRSGYHYIDTPFLSVLILLLAVRLWQDRRPSAAIWSGIALGLGVQTYYASQIVPILLAATTVGVAIGAPKRADRMHYLAQLAITATVAVAIAAPLFAHYFQHPDELTGRLQETSFFAAESRRHLAFGYGTDSMLRQLWIQVAQAASLFHLVGDNSVQYGYKAALLDPLSGIFFIAGIGTVLAYPTRLVNVIAIIWITIPLLLGSILTIDTPFFPRISGILPIVALVMAIGASRIAATLAAMAVDARRERWTLALTALLLTSAVAYNSHSYFNHYAPNHLHSSTRQMAEWIVGEGRGVKTYLLDPQHFRTLNNGTINFIAGQYAREDVRDIEAFFENENVSPRRSRFIVTPGGEDIVARLQTRFADLQSEPVRDGHDRVIFYGLRPAQASATTATPRKAYARIDRAIPWLALIGLIGLLAAAAAGRQRARSPRLPAPSFPQPATGSPAGPAVEDAALPRWIVGLALLAILVLASWLRITRLEELPAGFYCDEAGNAYNAASILETGRDETGAFLPLYVWSFDTSYKNPLFIYASTIPIAIFGPTPFAARLTSALFGIAAVAGLFLLGRAMVSTTVGLFAALFLAVLPWHVHFSRIAFELITFPTLFIYAALALVLFTKGRRSLSIAAFLLGLSLYTYVPAKMFVPLFAGLFAIGFRDQLWARRQETIAAAMMLAITVAPVVVFDLTNDRSSRYFRDTTFLTPDISVLDAAQQLAENYAHFFSPIFLFERGDRIVRHAVLDHGELYTVLAPLLLLGLVALIRSRSRTTALVLVWLALYPLAASFIRREIPSASRGIIGAPAFCLLAALGADWVWRACRRVATEKISVGTLRTVALGSLLIMLGSEAARYWTLYSEDYAAYAAKYFVGFQYGHEQAVDYLLDHYDEYDRVLLTTTWSNQPEIFLRFFAGLKQPPQSSAPPFEMPPKMNRGTPEELHLYDPDERLLFAVVPRDLLYFADYDIVAKVTAPDGSPAFVLTEVHEPKDFAAVWIMAGPYPPHETPPLPDFDPARPPQKAPGGRDWQRYQLRKAPVYLDRLYGEETDNACAWAINFAYSPKSQQVSVFAGFDDEGEIWVNGSRIPLIGTENAFNTWIDTQHATINLNEGRNRIAVKTCDLSGAWRFYFRLAGADGLKVPGLDWEYVFEEGL